MAAQSNGRAKKPKKPTANGHTSHANGHIDNSKLSAPAIRTPTNSRPKKTMARSLMNVIARLTTWYILITVLFRCPSSLTQISETSPRICSPYLQVRSYVTPYLDPYYQQYVAPQVKKVKPYVDRFESQIYTPAASFTKEKYTIYGAHRVEQAKKYAEAEWNKSVRPQLQTAQVKVKEQYEQHLSEHVKKASDLASPYYEETKKSLDEIYHLTLLPAYDAALPYARTAYAHGHHTVAHIIFPLVQSARDTTWTFILRTVWPQVRILYGDNVEPQLVRIRERLGRYRDQQKIESIVEAAEPQTSVISEETKVITSTDISSATSSVSPSSSASSSSKGGWGVLDDFFGGGDAASSSSSSSNDNAQVKTPTIPEPPKLTGAELKAKLNEDLRKWQTKFAVAADKGAEDLEQRVEEITKRQVENGVNGHGKALVVQLEETAKSAVEAFKRFIKETVKSIPEDATEEEVENAYEKCVAKTREFGLAVREKAQNIRSWKATYDQQTDALVQAAVRSTVEVLEKIHGLGLQEVGMRWAWTDGVTYKDWQNYHKLRTTLQEWQKEVEAVGSRHDGLRIAHEEAKSLEDQAMTAASKMVEELVRLKNVSKWKIWAGDATDDFTDKAVPPRVFKAAQQVLENAESASSQVSEAVVGSETPATESISSSVKDALSDASSKVAESIIDHETVEAAESVASDAKTKLSEVVIDSVSSATSSASELLEHVERAASESKEVVEEAVSSATESPKKVFGGAMAQVLAEAKQVIFDEVIDDDDDEPTPVLKNLHAQASSRYSEAVSVAGAQFENAKSQFSELVSGTPKPAHETMLSMIEKAYSDSVAAASERLEAALHLTDSVKSYAAGPTQGYFDSVSSIASSRLSEGLSVASARFSSQPTPALEGARRQYYEAIGIAHGRYSEFIEAASSAVYGPQQGTIESIVSVASESAESLASAASESAESLASEASSSIIGSETPWTESVASQASQNWESLIAKASNQVYGAPTPWAESVYHQAGEYGAQATSRAAEQYSAVHSLISELVVGKEPDFTESVMRRLSSAYYTGIPEVYASASSVVNSIFTPPPAIETILSQANEQLNAAVESASIAIYGTPQGAFEQAQESFSAVAANAQSAMSVAIFGTPAATGYAASVSSVYNSVSSVASENVENAASAISSAVYGPEQGAVESASSRLAEAIEAANSRINELYAGASKSAAEAASHAAEAAADATQRIKDEL